MTFNDEFDQVLDDALAEYREAEPLAGLEDRVLRRVATQAERRRKPWWQWSAIAAATAVLAIATWIGLSDHARRAVPSPVVQKEGLPEQPHSQTTNTQATNAPASKPTQGDKTARSRSAHVPAAAQLASAEHPPVREQFPTLAPLKAEERVLLALAQNHPEALRELARGDDDQEISIALIDIKPLVDETGGNQGEN